MTRNRVILLNYFSFQIQINELYFMMKKYYLVENCRYSTEFIRRHQFGLISWAHALQFGFCKSNTKFSYTTIQLFHEDVAFDLRFYFKGIDAFEYFEKLKHEQNWIKQERFLRIWCGPRRFWQDPARIWFTTADFELIEQYFP